MLRPAPPDITPPVLTLPANIVKEATSATGAVVTFTVSATDDRDGEVPVSATPASGSVFPLGATTVSCSAADKAGNTATGSFTVTVVDTTGPCFCPPGNKVEEATGPLTPVNLGSPAWVWDATDPNPTVTDNAPAAFPLGVTTVTWTVTDASGNARTGTQTVTITDTTGPCFCPSENKVKEATGPLTPVNLGSPAWVWDATDPNPTVTNDAPAAGFPLGVTTVTWTATDALGNAWSQTRTVTITDTIGPCFCPPGNKVEEATGPLTPVNLGSPAWVWDATDPNPTVTNDAPAAGFPVGVTTVTWTATDALGNSRSNTQTVTVTQALRYANFTWIAPMANTNKKLFKRGSTIPVKFTITDLQGNPATSATATIAVYYYHDGAPDGEALVVSTSNGDLGDQFRYTDGQYLFNLSTKPPEWTPYYTFLGEVTLDDGQKFTQVFSLK